MRQNMTRKPILPFFFPLIVLLMLQACAAIRPEPPRVSLKSLELKGFNLSHARFQAELELFNPNAYSLTVRHADYRLKLNGVEISRGQSASSTEIAGHQSGLMTLHLTAAYLDLARFLNRATAGTSLTYQLDGTVEIGGFGVFSYPYPIHKEGSIDPQDWAL